MKSKVGFGTGKAILNDVVVEVEKIKLGRNGVATILVKGEAVPLTRVCVARPPQHIRLQRTSDILQGTYECFVMGLVVDSDTCVKDATSIGTATVEFKYAEPETAKVNCRICGREIEGVFESNDKIKAICGCMLGMFGCDDD